MVQYHLQHLELVAMQESLNQYNYRVVFKPPKFVGKTLLVFPTTFYMGVKEHLRLVAPFLDPEDDAGIICKLVADPTFQDENIIRQHLQYLIKERGFSANAL